jgi:hypothetical protein
MSTWPTGNVPTTNVNESTDDPSLARPNIKTAFDRINDILNSRGVNDGIPTLGTTGGIPRSELGLVLSTTGGSLTGPVYVTSDPSANLELATKQYVDNLGVADDSIATTHIQDLQITSAKLAAAAVTTGKIAAQSVLTADLKDLNVTEGKIAAGAVTNTKLGSNSVAQSNIQSNAVGNSQVASQAIHRAELYTTTVSLSGNVTGVGVNITLVAYAFFPMIHCTNGVNQTYPSTIYYYTHMMGSTVDYASADTPAFRLGYENNKNPTVTDATYDVDYRYVIA